MAREYELWLDESGEFDREKEKAADAAGFSRGFHPSLIGGWLVEYNRYHQQDLEQFVIASPTGDQYHVAGIDTQVGKQLVFSSMETIHDEFGGKMVLFQNKELEDFGNRELYLRLMASGLLQLLQELNAGRESVKLHVIIARRMDMTETDVSRQEILDNEYRSTLGEYINAKKKTGRIMLHEDTEMSITIDSARRDNRLKVADYVCNTELTLSSGKFTEAERNTFLGYLEDAYVYSFDEDTTENSVKMALSQGNVADALVEAVFNTKGKAYLAMLRLIANKIITMGYRGAKVQFEQCTKEFTTYIYMEDDFERGEEYLFKLLDEAIPLFESKGLPCEKFRFAMELLLVDMFLREGDIDRAAKEMEKCTEAESALPSSLENLLQYYQLIEKKALLAIDSFEFAKGFEMMKETCDTFSDLIEYIQFVDALKDRFPNMISEYYGDALCMKIYAGLFMQRSDPELYRELTGDSDIALLQYGPHEGELERHRQYRSVIEMQNGNYEAAAKWLLMTQPGDITMASLEDGSQLTKKDFSSFLKSVIEGEGKSARRYYLMYYVKIMAEAALNGDAIADEMYAALKSNPGIQEAEDLQDSDQQTDHGTRVSESVIRDLDYVIRPARYIDYHPLEINYWKQATYEFSRKSYKAAEALYKKALKVCYSYSEYIQLAVIGLGIRAEYIVCLMDHGNTKEAGNEYRNLLNRIEKLMSRTEISEIKAFIQEMGDCVRAASKDGELSRDEMWKASRRVAF